MERFTLVAIFLFFLCLPLSLLAESSSENFILWGSAVTSGGGRLTSGSYINYVSVGDLGNDPLSSESYRSVIGLQAIYEEPIITMQISTTDLDLSPRILDLNTVSTALLSVTVSTNADFGYALTITEVMPLNNGQGRYLADVADGEVTSGFEEFGLAVSGDDAAFSDDRPLSSTPLFIAGRDIWGANRTTGLTFKAAIGSTSASGLYFGSYSLIATGRF